MLNRTESIAEVGTKDCYSYSGEWNICYGGELAGYFFILQLRKLIDASQKSRFNSLSQQSYVLEQSFITIAFA